MQTTTLYKLGFSVALAAFFFACGGSAEKPAADATPASMTAAAETSAAAPLSPDEARTLLEKARATSAALTSYHASQTLGNPPAVIEADLGPGATSVHVTRPDGTKWQHIAAGDRDVVSTDDGATWNDDENQAARTMSQTIAGPMQVMPKILADPEASVAFVAHELVDGTQAAHIRLATKAAPIDVWVADDPTLGPYIRRITYIVAMNDGEFPSDVKYSKLNVPVEIAIPQ
jgi:hypothetical protein